MKLYVIKMGEGYLAGRSPDGNLVVTDSRRHACRWLRQAARDKVSRLGKCFRLVRLVPKRAKTVKVVGHDGQVIGELRAGELATFVAEPCGACGHSRYVRDGERMPCGHCGGVNQSRARGGR